MPPEKGKEPDLAFAGLALLVIFALLIWHDNPIQSARPFDSSSQPQYPHVTDHAYESWLWQDPFSFDSSSEIQRDQYHIELDENKETKTRHYKVLKKLDLDSKDSKINSTEEGQCTFQLRNKIHADAGQTETTFNGQQSFKIFASILKVRPNTIENKELRTRHRYAMIAGLIESGYIASEPHHLNFCFVQNKSNRDNGYDIRWEHFTYEKKYKSDTNKPDIILFWVDSKAVNNESFGRFVEEINSEKSLDKSVYDGIENLYIFDWSNSKKINEKIAGVERKKYAKIEIKRPVDSNKEIAEALIFELKERGIKKLSEIVILTEHDTDNARNLAKNFCEQFWKQAEYPLGYSDPPPFTGAKIPCEIRNIFYLKGLDAYQQIIDKQDRNEELQAARKWNGRLSITNLHNPPIGPTQFDYLHRLATEIKDTHNEIDLKERVKGVKTVGIFGSDFYDKLLILQALRAEMPNLLVFTTDLDAQMFHPQHWRWTRNLIVVSHFDLRLDKKLQKYFSAFRDSRQTEIFYKTISILNKDVKGNHKLPQEIDNSPAIFEISRHGPVRMAYPFMGFNKLRYVNKVNGDVFESTAIDNFGAATTIITIHPVDNNYEQLERRFFLFLCIALVLIFLIYGAHPPSGYLCIGLLITTFIVFSIAWFLAIITNDFGEPLSFTDGISLWPTLFIHVIAIALAIAFLWEVVCCLEGNFYQLNRKFFKNDLKTLCTDAKPRSYKDILTTLARCCDLFCITLIGAFLIISVVYASNDWEPDGFINFYVCLLILGISGGVYWTLELKLLSHLKSVRYWIGKGSAPQAYCQLINLEANNGDKGLWQEYHEHGRLRWRFTRVIMMWIIFAFIETILFYLLPPWLQPCRGETCIFWDWLIGIVSFIVIMILIFFVLDAFRLSYFWIKKLRTKHPLLVEKRIFEKDLNPEDLKLFNAARVNKPFDKLEEIVSLVAERTQVVDKLIYYPLLCIILMLFARIIYFDNQDFPLSKSITFFTSVSLLIFAGFVLRSEAKKFKLAVINSAKQLVKDCGLGKAEADATIERISNNNDGIFEPMLEQPVMRALLLILAAIGVFAGEYMMLFG